MKKSAAAPRKIIRALDEPTQLEFIETPLAEVIDYLKDLHGIEIQLDQKALDAAGVAIDIRHAQPQGSYPCGRRCDRCSRNNLDLRDPE